MSDFNENQYLQYNNDKTNNITIEAITIRAFAKKLKDYFMLPNIPLMINSNDKWRIIQSIYKQKQIKISYPILSFRIGTMEINTEGYNNKSLNRMGRLGSRTSNDSHATRIEPIQTRTNVEVSYWTDDYHQLSHFSNLWLFASVTKTLNMNIVFDGHEFPTHIEPDSAITMPQKDNSPDMINLFELESTIIIKGYMSQNIPFNEYAQVPLISSISASTVMGPKGTDKETADVITKP